MFIRRFFLTLSDLALFSYGGLIHLLHLTGHSKSTRFIQGRKNQNWDQIAEAGPFDFLFHVSSLGEFEQARPVIESLASKEYKILVTFFSPSGYDVISKRTPRAYTLAYLPLPTKGRMARFIQKTNPQAVVLTKYDFWWRLLSEANKQHIPCAVIAGKFKPSDYFIRNTTLGKQLLSLFTYLDVQDSKSYELSQQLGCSPFFSGDPRFDRVFEQSQVAFSDKRIEEWTQSKEGIMVIGSAWKEEVLMVEQLAQKLPKWGFIVACHELQKGIAWLENTSLEVDHYTQYPWSKNILNIDTFGLLSSLYRFGDICIIGGGFGAGVHNTLEAAIYNKPICFGPNFEKFTEAVELTQRGGALVLKSHLEVDSIIELAKDPEVRKDMAQSNQSYCQTNLGAASKITEHLLRIIQN